MAERDILVKITNKVVGLEELQKEKQVMQQVNQLGKEGSVTVERQNKKGVERLNIQKKTNQAGIEQFTVQKDIIQQAPRFRMEHLGVMFAGMALQRSFSSLTKTSKEWLGIGEIMSTTMGVVMLPATMNLLEGTLGLSEVLMDMPQWMQGIIGTTALLGEGLGGLLMTFGQLALGVASFKLAFPLATAKIVAMTSSVFSLTSAFTGLTVAMIAVPFAIHVQGLANASKEYNKLGEDIRSTTEILGQYGQMTRETTKSPPKGIDTSISPEIINSSSTSSNATSFKFNIPTTTIKDLGIIGGGSSVPEEKEKTFFGRLISSVFGTKSYAVGTTNVPSNGMYMLHQGEQVLRKDQSQSQGQNITIQYHVNATSMREVESMLRESERRVTADIRRLSR